MFPRARPLFLPLAVAVSLLVSGLASAQNCDEQRARDLFVQGNQLLQNTLYADAARALRQSADLCERPSTLYNLGLALRGTNQCRDALRAFTRAAEIESEAEARAAAETHAREMRACIAHVTLNVRGFAQGDASSTAVVDGHGVELRDGVSALELDPGRHVFEARRRGYQPTVGERTLVPGERAELTLDVAARPLPSTIQVETGDASATVRIDGRAAEAGHAVDGFEPGPHEVEVQFSSSDVQRRTVVAQPGGRLVVTLGPRGRDPLYTRWWFWTAIGVAVVGGVVVGGIALFSREDDPYRGLWGHAEAITFGR